MKKIAWLLYNGIFPIVFAFMLPRFLYRMWKRGGYRKGFLQRLGIYAPDIQAGLRTPGRIWIHAVSVGEIFVALRFMLELRKSKPEAIFVLTTATSTAHALAQRQLKPPDLLLYFPIDIPPVIKRVLNLVKPSALILVECEFWPNLIRNARQRQIPVILLNGRISDRSYRGYQRLRPFIKSLLGCFDCICAQGAQTAQRLITLGAEPRLVHVMGSAKYDVAQLPDMDQDHAEEVSRTAGFKTGSKLLVGGSTWPGEETALLQCYRSLRRRHADARLVLVPRHVERMPEIVRELDQSEFTYARWSKLGNAPQGETPPDVLLVDTTGELLKFYAAATVIFIGKSLSRRGGQNPIEAAVFAKPIIVGPNMQNFAAVMDDFLAAGAVIRVKDQVELEQNILKLWQDPDLRQDYGERARRVVREKAGVIPASIKLILPLLEKNPSTPADPL